MKRMTDIVHVTAVEVVGDHRLRLAFEDGAEGEVDLSGWQWRGVFEVFSPVGKLPFQHVAGKPFSLPLGEIGILHGEGRQRLLVGYILREGLIKSYKLLHQHTD